MGSLHPDSIIEARRKTKQEAEEQARLAALPADPKIILVPADPTHTPTERDLWPLIYSQVLGAIRRTIDEHQGWQNPFAEPA